MGPPAARLPAPKRIQPYRVPLSTLVVAVMLLASGEAAEAGQTGREGLDRGAIEALVVEEATRMGVPVALALAVAHAESSFDPSALSHKGARGVMQIMPKTALGEYGIGPELLWHPRINVRLGLHFLKRLLWRYRGRTDLALSYYNGGSAVGDLPHARVIPATAAYVERVERLRQRYSGRSARR